MPTYSENFGIVVAEALASMTPVLTTTGTPWQGLVENQCGWWCEPNVDDLEATFHRVIADEAKYLEMGERGREWIEVDFCWSGIAKSMEAFYQRILR
ncbi:glycosyltransferase [Rubritalea profundi]|uniref:Glycosyl transferase family 1 domain-containing protein n=1 Tax=Rubritalea profundi TaxID=1658618 RepID=A0A2S7U0Y4_9BACT|nr:glycosyltransferase [Rubritalea profundi]PQJ28054.1 hypothetical protein BSZ32_05755 [Rubritalea profundi]